MAARSDAAIVLPGGFGTLDEVFELLTWNQLGLVTMGLHTSDCSVPSSVTDWMPASDLSHYNRPPWVESPISLSASWENNLQTRTSSLN